MFLDYWETFVRNFVTKTYPNLVTLAQCSLMYSKRVILETLDALILLQLWGLNYKKNCKLTKGFFLKQITFIFHFLFHNSHDKFDRQIIVSNQIES